jgi:hypothetical protein
VPKNLDMKENTPAITTENQELTKELERLNLEFLDLFARHREMVDNESVILTSLYLEKLGLLQLELLEKQTESARLKMKMDLIQAASNRDEKPDLKAIETIINKRLHNYYAEIQLQSAALNVAKEVLSHLISPEEYQKLKEIFRVLCKRLHPDLNPNQTEEEKDLFIKVKAAYDLRKLSDLQSILLFLDDYKTENLANIPGYEKKDRIEYLKKNILVLNDKIDQLKQTFPFNIENLIYDDGYIRHKQEEIQDQIKTVEEKIIGFLNIIMIMTNE